MHSTIFLLTVILVLEIFNLFNDTPDTFLLQSLWFCGSGSNCLCVFVLLEKVPGGSWIVGIGSPAGTYDVGDGQNKTQCEVEGFE